MIYLIFIVLAVFNVAYVPGGFKLYFTIGFVQI